MTIDGRMIGRQAAGALLVACAMTGTIFALKIARTPVATIAAPQRVDPLPLPARPKPAPPPTGPAAVPPAQVGYVVKRILPIAGVMHQGDYYWDEAGVPTGPVVITVDLAAQTVSAFRDGYEIGTAVIVYGADEKPTPLGIFPITQKDADHVSNLYDAPMPYMLRLTNDGISIHGSKVGDGYATHGCIGVPVPFARKLFDAVQIGDRVIVTRGKMLGLGQAITAT